MIENLMYFVLVVQIFFLTNHILHVAVTLPSFIKYLWLFSMGIAAFFWLIFYAMKPGKFVTLILSFVLGFALFGLNYRYDFLIFLSLYLYLLGKLHEKHLLTQLRAIVLLPVLLFGFLPLKIKGIFESVFQHKIHALLYSTSSNVSGNSISVNKYVIAGNGGTGSLHKFGTLSSSLFTSSRAFENIVITLGILLLLGIFLLFVAKFYLVSKNKKVFFASMFVGITVIVGVSAIASFMFFSIVKLYNAVVSGLGHISIRPDKIPPTQSGTQIVVKHIVGSEKFIRNITGILRVSGLLISILGILLGGVLIYIIWSVLFKSVEEQSLFTRKESEKFTGRIKRKGINRSLSEIENPEEYVKFLYFSALYLLRQKGYSIQKFETPNEFLIRLSHLTDRPVYNFDVLTEIFNKVKYGKSVDDMDISKLKRKINDDKLIKSIRDLPNRKKDSFTSAKSDSQTN